MLKMLGNSMKKGKIELTSGGKKLVTMRIRRGIFRSLTITFYVSTDTHVVGTERGKGKVSVERYMRKSESASFHEWSKFVRTKRKTD